MVPCSGGKDGSYVAYNLKHKYGVNPLCVTVTPALTLALGDRNLRSFVSSGYERMQISAHYDAWRVLKKTGFSEMGFPYYGWLICLHTAVIRMAIKFGIDLIFYVVQCSDSTDTDIWNETIIDQLVKEQVKVNIHQLELTV